ncbi:MAG: response regulator [Eudoraea sp.]|uniref:response regulator n=1 Tax=Eudoraea sp. TaxID=1979955 RepID=UPI003C72DFFA
MKKFENVCIIDDDPILIYGIKRLMKEVNFGDDILVYNNGKDAINGLRLNLEEGKKLPSIIFLDLNMPIMNGWDFLEDFCKIGESELKNTTIYIISSSVDPRDLIRIKGCPIVKNYILKPVTAKDLAAIQKEEVA